MQPYVHPRDEMNKFFTDVMGKQSTLGIREEDNSVSAVGAITNLQSDGRGFPGEEPYGKKWRAAYDANERLLRQDPGYLFVEEVAGFTDQPVEEFVIIDESLKRWQQLEREAQIQSKEVQRRLPTLEELSKQIEEQKKIQTSLQYNSEQLTDKFIFLSNMLYDFSSKDPKFISAYIQLSLKGVKTANAFLANPTSSTLTVAQFNKMLKELQSFVTEVKQVNALPKSKEDLEMFRNFVNLISEIDNRLKTKKIEQDLLLSKIKFILFFGKTDRQAIEKMVKDYGGIPYPTFFFQGQIEFIGFTPSNYYMLAQHWFNSQGIANRDLGNPELKDRIENLFKLVDVNYQEDDGAGNLVAKQRKELHLDSESKMNFRITRDDVFAETNPFPFFLDRSHTDFTTVTGFMWDRWGQYFYKMYYEVTKLLAGSTRNLAVLEADQVNVLTGVKSLEPPSFPYTPSVEWSFSPNQTGMARLNTTFLSALHKALQIVLEKILRYWTNKPETVIKDQKKVSDLLEDLTTTKEIRTNFAELVSFVLFENASIRPKRYLTDRQMDTAQFKMVEIIHTLQGNYTYDIAKKQIARRPAPLAKRKYLN